MPKKFENKFVFTEGGDIEDEIYNFINFIKELDLCIDKEDYKIHKYISENIKNKPIEIPAFENVELNEMLNKAVSQSRYLENLDQKEMHTTTSCNIRTKYT